MLYEIPCPFRQWYKTQLTVVRNSKDLLLSSTMFRIIFVTIQHLTLSHQGDNIYQTSTMILIPSPHLNLLLCPDLRPRSWIGLIFHPPQRRQRATLRMVSACHHDISERVKDVQFECNVFLHLLSFFLAVFLWWYRILFRNYSCNKKRISASKIISSVLYFSHFWRVIFTLIWSDLYISFDVRILLALLFDS